MELVPAGYAIAKVPDPAVGLTGPTLAQRLIDEREARGMTRMEFARELRTSAKNVKAWEEQRRYPDVDMLQWIVKHLGWDGAERKFAITFVAQRIVQARSAGEAMRQAWDDIERVTSSPRQARVISVRPVAERRRKVRD